MIWQSLAEQQQRIIDELISFCDDLLARLSQYESIEDEERRLRQMEGDKINESNTT